MNLEKQFAKSMAHFTTVEEFKAYKSGVQDVCSVGQPMLDEMLEMLQEVVSEYDNPDNGRYLRWAVDEARVVIAKVTGDTK